MCLFLSVFNLAILRFERVINVKINLQLTVVPPEKENSGSLKTEKT